MNRNTILRSLILLPIIFSLYFVGKEILQAISNYSQITIGVDSLIVLQIVSKRAFLFFPDIFCVFLFFKRSKYFNIAALLASFPIFLQLLLNYFSVLNNDPNLGILSFMLLFWFISVPTFLRIVFYSFLTIKQIVHNNKQ